MSSETLATLLGSFLVLILWLVTVTWMLAQMSIKVNTMWEFQIRRGVTEGVRKGMFKVNSPIQILESELREALQPLVPEMVELYENTKPKDDVALAILLERRFGQKLAKEICARFDVHDAACLVAAIVLVKEAVGRPTTILKEKANDTQK